MKEVLKGCIQAENGGEIPITLFERNGLFELQIDGVSWFEISNEMHAKVLFLMMRDHITDYMHYITTK